MIVKDEKLSVCVNKTIRFSFEREDNLLTAMENKNIDVHFHCREGFCGACRTKLLSGKVEYKVDPLACIEDDEILACCCIPVTNVEIETY
ncbi:class I ribonucleotide reductase maintenance protein YfaE [Glaciecola sp. XM2]|uniref:class I ribonucleotide reductase maintenance protein YfaE n=1 Tax=Glaciecola sp. XM2 TaxID=1914931 RepID=UPI00332D2D49